MKTPSSTFPIAQGMYTPATVSGTSAFDATVPADSSSLAPCSPAHTRAEHQGSTASRRPRALVINLTSSYMRNKIPIIAAAGAFRHGLRRAHQLLIGRSASALALHVVLKQLSCLRSCELLAPARTACHTGMSLPPPHSSPLVLFLPWYVPFALQLKQRLPPSNAFLGFRVLPPSRLGAETRVEPLNNA